MKNLVIITGANSSGKTTFCDKLDNSKFAVVHTDYLYDMSEVHREFAVKTDKKDNSFDIVGVNSRGVITHAAKVDLLDKLLKGYNNVVLEGKRFFSNHFMSTLKEYLDKGVNVVVVYVTYNPSLCRGKLEANGKVFHEYYNNDKVAEYECEKRFLNSSKALPDGLKSIIFDVSDYGDWGKVYKFINKSCKGKPNKKEFLLDDMKVDYLKQQSDGVSEIFEAVKRLEEGTLGRKKPETIIEELVESKVEIKRVPIKKPGKPKSTMVTSLEPDELVQRKSALDLEIKDLRARSRAGEGMDELILEKRKQRRKLRNLINKGR